MTGEIQNRGRHFEALIGRMLDALANIHPERVEVIRRPQIEPDHSSGLEPAFELTYHLADRRRRRLIACDDGSALAPERLAGSKRTAGTRVMYLYHLDPLDGDRRRALEAAGVVPYSLVGFGVFLDEVNRALAAATELDAALFRLELMKTGRHYPALRTAFSRMRSDSSFVALAEDESDDSPVGSEGHAG